MNRRDNTYQEVEADAVAGLQARADGLTADAGHPDLTVGLVFERVVHVVRQLAVDADWLQAVQHGVAGSFEHSGCLSFALPTTSRLLQ